MKTSNLPTGTLPGVVQVVNELAQREKHLQVRVRCVDGADVLGHSLMIDSIALHVIAGADEEDVTTIMVPLAEVQSILVGTPNRNREGMLAMLAVIGTVSVLTAYSLLPWVHPQKGEPTTGMVLVFIGTVGAGSLLFAHTGLRDWLERWRQVYPPP